MNNSSPMSKEELMKKIMEYCFALIDLELYLDTHPHDTDCLMKFNSLKERSHALKIEYARHYGPITFSQVTSDNYWTWISTPWPWEGVC